MFDNTCWMDARHRVERAAVPSARRRRVLVVQNDRLAAEALMFTLDSEPALEPIGYALDGWEAIALIDAFEPDVVLVGSDVGGLDRLELSWWTHEFFPEVASVLVWDEASAEQCEAAYAAGAESCLAASCSADELLLTLATAGCAPVSHPSGDTHLRLVSAGDARG